MRPNNPTNEPRHDGDDSDETIDLRSYVAVAWRRKTVIAILTALCGVVVLIGDLMAPATYEATARLLVSASKTGTGNQIAEALSVDSFRALDVATFRALVHNQAVAASVVAEFGLGAPRYSLTPLMLLDRCLKVEIVPDTNIIELTVSLPEPQAGVEGRQRLCDGDRVAVPAFEPAGRHLRAGDRGDAGHAGARAPGPGRSAATRLQEEITGRAVEEGRG